MLRKSPEERDRLQAEWLEAHGLPPTSEPQPAIARIADDVARMRFYVGVIAFVLVISVILGAVAVSVTSGRGY